MIIWPSVTVAARGQRDDKNSSCSDVAIATMTWEHGDCLLMTHADHTFNLVIDKGDLDCIMCSSDQIERRMNTYRDEVGRVPRLGDLEDEDGYRNNNEGREENSGTVMTPLTEINAKRTDKNKSATTTAVKKNKKKNQPREESCGVVELVKAMLVLMRMYKLILCMVRDVRTITT